MTTLLSVVGKFMVSAIASLFFAILEKSPDWLAGKLLDRIGKRRRTESPKGVMLFSPDCGEMAIDLAQQRLLISSAFGSYFAGLLERERSYVNLEAQIAVPMSARERTLEPIQSIYWALQHPKGPKVLLIAAEGGMGKSTLAAKIIRCLYEERAIDMILGDSAKAQALDPLSGAVIDLDPAYYSLRTFFETVYNQLGLPFKEGQIHGKRAIEEIQDRIEGRRAVIVADNLETVAEGAELLSAMRQLASRDTRVIMTTRSVSGLTDRSEDIFLVRLEPITKLSDAQNFLRWHLDTHSREHPDLRRLEQDIENRKKVQLLLNCTGGIPLLIQLVTSDIARFSWSYAEGLPHLFGKELLDFLYRERWAELMTLGQDGFHAMRLLRFVSTEQYRGRKITLDRINKWAAETGGCTSPQTCLRLLQERFLIVNHDPEQGNFAVFPSLAEFLKGKDVAS